MSSHFKKRDSGLPESDFSPGKENTYSKATLESALDESSIFDEPFSAEDEHQAPNVSNPLQPSTGIQLGTKRKKDPSQQNPSKIPKLAQPSKLPHFGIRRVNFKTVIQKLPKCTNISTNSYKGLEDIMDAIMSSDQDQNQNKKTTPPYILETTNQNSFGDFYSNHSKLLPGGEFKLRAYAQRKHYANNYFLTHFTGIENTDGRDTSNSVVFYYRPNDIFYVVQNHAWTFVNWCVDYEFPPAMSSRLLTPKGVISKTAKQILGNTRSTETTYNEPDYPETLFNPEFFVSYEANVRENSSLFNLPLSIIQNLEPNKITQVTKNVKAEVGLGYFKFLKSLTKYDILAICHHFSTILARQPTYLYKEPQTQEKVSLTYESSFMQVTRALSNQLTKNLAEILFDPYRLDIPEEVRNFNAGHPHFKDFSSGNNFELFFQQSKKAPKKRICVFDGALQILEIIKAIKGSTDFGKKIQTTPLNKDCNLETILQKFYIQFTVGAYQKPPSNVLTFIEGFHLHSDNHLYWRINGGWHQVGERYLTRVHFEFNRQLNDGILISLEEDCCLEHKWYSVKQKGDIKKALIPTEMFLWENLYNCSYSLAEGDYIIGDTILLEDSIKPFDIMKIIVENDVPRAYLYHVINGLDNTRTACVQIENAAKAVQATAVTNVMQIEQFYWDLQEKCKHNKKILEKYEVQKFTELLQNAIYVLAFVDGEEAKKNVSKYGKAVHSNRSFALEKQTKIDFSVKNLETIISRLGIVGKLYSCLNIPPGANGRCKSCAMTILSLLRDSGYIDTMNQPTTKFLTATAAGFKLAGCSKSQNQNIWYALSEFRSSYSSLVTKLEIIRTSHSLNGKFRICEIFVDDDKDFAGNKAHLEFVQDKFNIEVD